MATVAGSQRQLTHTSNTYESNGDVTIGGNLNINGTTTTIDTANLLVEDKNIIIGDVASPTNTTADGGGITLKGATDKTINWVNSTSSWTSNQTFSAPNLTLTSLSNQSSEATALVVNGSNVVGTRELGSAAFSATSAFLGATAKAADSDKLDNLDSTQFLRSDVDDTTTGKITFAKGSSGSLAARTGFSDFLGYNTSYGSYIGGGVGNAIRYLYAGGYINDGNGVHGLWHAGNDGSGSGLDADLLDGNHASAFATASHSHAASDITSGTLADARIPSLAASKITSGTFADARIASASNWNTAYGWGNHASAGYITGNQAITLSGAATGSGTTSISVSLAADSVGSAEIAANAVGASEIAASAVGASELNVSGNGTTTQFLRSDGDGTFTWATPTDTNTTYSAGNGISLSGTTFSVAAGGGLTQTSTGLSHSDTSSQASVNNTGGTVIQDITLDTYGHITAISSNNLDGRYYTESEVNTLMARGYANGQAQSATGLTNGAWYTIAENTGDRAVARFGLRDSSSGDHQSVIFYAAHNFGTDASNTITVLHNSHYSGSPFRYIRIKDNETYDGAVLQVYVDTTHGSSDTISVYLLGDNFQGSGWVLVDWLADATAPSTVSNYSSFSEKSRIDLDQIAQGGIATTGPIYGDGDTTQYRMFNDNYHPNADKLTTARNIALTGAVTGNANFDGSANISIATTATADPTLTLAGDASGSATFTNLGNATLTVTVADDSHNHVISNVDGLQAALDAKQASGTYNTIIGTDSDINTSGSTIIDNIFVTDGVITSMGTRTLALADLGYTGATNANNYSLPLAASGTRGGVQIGYAENGKNYPVEINSSEQMFVNVPWTDNNTTYSAGTHLSLSGTTFNVDFATTDKVVNIGHNATTNNEGEIILDTSIAGSPQIGFTEHGDASWAIGIDDQDNSFKIHGNANTTIPTINNLSIPLFEVTTTAGTAYLNNNRIFHAGYHPNADTLTTARTISLGGDLSGSASFNGSSNITITAAVADDSHNHVISNVDGLQTALDAKAPLASPAFTGNVGIGTTSPTRTLHVNSGALNFAALFQSTDDKASILIQDNDTLNYIHSQDGYLSLGGQSSLHASNLNIRTSDGNVGIGTTSPSAKLDVEGPIAQKVYTASTLPSASPAGQRAFISDSAYGLATAIGSIVSGGGGNTIPVYSDGSSWRAG